MKKAFGDATSGDPIAPFVFALHLFAAGEGSA